MERRTAVVKMSRSELIATAHRMFGSSLGVTTRAEFRMKVLQLQENYPGLIEESKKILLTFYLHGRHDNIRFSGKPGAEGFFIKMGGDGKHPPRAKKIRGIHSLLRKVFYPDFDRSEHEKCAKKSVAKEKKKQKKTNKNYKTPGNAILVPHRSTLASGCSWSMVDLMAQDTRGVGAELGKQVHKQLEIFARCRVTFAREVPRPDPLVTEVIHKIIVEWRLIPLWSEYEIWDEVLKYATSVDMICFNPVKKRLVFFEVKTGYKDSFSFSTGKKIRGRFGIDSNPLNHAILQIAIPIETMKRRYGIRAIDGYVLHVNERTGVTVYKVPSVHQLPRDRMYNYIVQDNKKDEKKAPKRKRVTKRKKPRPFPGVSAMSFNQGTRGKTYIRRSTVPRRPYGFTRPRAMGMIRGHGRGTRRAKKKPKVTRKPM